MTTDNVVMWVTRLSIVDWVYFKTQTLLAPLRKGKFLEKWVESPSVFIQQHVFFDILAAIWIVLSLKPESALWLVPCRNEDKTQPRVMGLRWQLPDLPVWCCKASAKRGVSTQGSGSPVNPVNEYNRKRVGLATGNWGRSSWNAEVGSSQVYRKEMVSLAARRLGQKDVTRAKSEEDSPCSGQPYSSIPRNENMKFSNYPYVEKVFQCMLSSEWILTRTTYWHGECSWHRRWRQPSTLGKISCTIRKYTRIQNSRTSRMCSTYTPKIIKEHFEEILHVKTLDNHSPSWTRSILFNDNVIKWPKAKVCVYADAVLCVGKIEQNAGAADAKWTGQIEDLIRYPSYQDAVGLDGEAIEFEWKRFPGFSTLTVLKEIQMDLERKNTEPDNFKDRIIFMSMFDDIEWKNNDENCISNAERDGTVAHMMDNGTVQPTKWYSNSKKLAIFFTATSALSRGMLKPRKGKCTIHFNGDFMNTELLCQTIILWIKSVFTRLLRIGVTQICFEEGRNRTHSTPVDDRIMAVVEPESFPNLAQGNMMMQSEAKFRSIEKRRFTWPNYVKKPYVTTGRRYQVQPDGEDGWGQISHLCREYLGSRVFPQANPLGGFSSRYNYRTDLWGSYCGDSWRIWSGSCESINLQTWRCDFRCDIQRNSSALFESLQDSKESMSYKQRV